MKPIDVKSLTPEICQMFVKQHALLTAGDKTACNTMTIGWAQMGSLWNLPVCTVYVRPERHTFRFMEENNFFTVSVLAKEDREISRICGTTSGRDTDKIRECGLTVAYGAGDAPYFEEAELVLVCRKLFVQDMDPACVRDERVSAFYTEERGNWHRIYNGEIVEAYIK